MELSPLLACRAPTHSLGAPSLSRQRQGGVLIGDLYPQRLQLYPSPSPSRAVRTSSSTSHFFKIPKIVFAPKPARIKARNILAACFWSSGFFKRFRRKYSRACFSSLTSSKTSPTVLVITSPCPPRTLRSVSTRRRPNFSLSLRYDENAAAYFASFK